MVRVPLTSGWQLEDRDVLRCLSPPDLWLSDSMPWSSRICPGFVRWPYPLPRDWVRPARSHRVGTAEIKVTGPSEDRMAAAAAARGRCHLARHWLLGRRGTAPDARIWRGFRLTDVWGWPRVAYRASRGASWPGVASPAIAVRRARRWADPLPGPRRAGAGHRPADPRWSRPGSGRCSTGPACSAASWPRPASTSVTFTIEDR